MEILVILSTLIIGYSIIQDGKPEVKVERVKVPVVQPVVQINQDRPYTNAKYLEDM